MQNSNDINQLKIDEKTGKNLSKEVIKFMIENRIREYGENTKDFENNEQDSMFFFLKKDHEIKAFGMLKPVTLNYSSIEYPIMGIGNIMALEKGKGYGKLLMEHIKNYLKKHNLVGLGNAYKTNLEFYKKCGFTFIPGFVDRLVYVDKNNKEHREDRTDYCMFILDKDGALDTVAKGKDEIIIRVPLW
jgi:GNAT superfamily N-acetyltransferase